MSEATLRSLPDRVRRGTLTLVHGVAVGELRRELDQREDVRAELGIEPDEVLVVTIANVRPEKDYPGLLAATELAVSSCSALRFLAIGGGPPVAEEDLRRRVAALSVPAGTFTYVGVRNDAVRLLAAADLFVLASRTEGLPIALVEALCLGIAVVATDVGGVGEAVRDGVEGLVVPPGRPDLLAAALVRLAADPVRRRALGTAAEVRGRDYEITRAVEVLESCYLDLVAGRKQPAVRTRTQRSERRVRTRA